MKRQTLAHRVRGTLLAVATVLGLSAVTARADYTSVVQGDGPVGYWRLDESSGTTAHSLLGGPNGTYSGSCSLGTPGLIVNDSDPAVAFASGGTVTVPYSATINPTNFTIEFWAQPANQSAEYVVSLQDRTTGSRIGYAFEHNNFSSQWDFTFGVTPSSYVNISGTTPVTAGTMYYVAATYDGTTVRLYVNGILENSLVTTYAPANPGAVNLTFGSRNGNSAYNGVLDEVAIYSHALTAAQIRSHFFVGAPQVPIVINQPPANVTQYEGDPAFGLKATLSSGTLPEYQWWKGGTIIDGATNSVLTIASTNASESGSYTVVISNSVSVVTSSPPTVVTITPVADPINTALVLNYQFKEGSGTTISDSSGNGNNATLYNDSASAWAPGRVNGAIVLNNGPAGSDCPSYILTDSALTLANQDNYTFAFWAKALPRNSIANPRIFTPFTHWLLWQSGRGMGFWSTTPSTVEPSTDFWHHFAVTYNRPAGQYLIYVDGEFKAKGPLTAGDGIRSAPGAIQWIIGHAEKIDGTYDTEPDNWKGYLSDVRMYNRTLRPSDISAIVALAPTVPPTITRQPQDTTAYATTSLILSVSVDGTQPISYQWYKGGSPVSGATSATYRVDNVTTSSAGSYTIVARNTAGSVTSAPPVTVTILTPPTTGYLAAILADSPEAYWRLDDTDSTLRDTMGRHNGTYQGSVSQGTTPGALTGDSSPCVTFGGAANLASVPASTNFNGTYTSGDFSMECWFLAPVGTSLPWPRCPYGTRNDGNASIYVGDAGLQIQWLKGPPNVNAAIYKATTVADGNWHHAVATYSKAANTMKFYFDGMLVDADTSANYLLMQTPGTPVQIGSDNGYDWPGEVDEVAWYNKTLASERIAAHYGIAKYGNFVPLTLSTLPQSQTVLVGSPVQFTVQAGGLPPFSYQWSRNGLDIPQATNNSYSIPSAYFTQAGNYTVKVACASGTTNSPAAVLTVIPQPSYVQMTNGLVVHLTFDGDCNDSSGRGNSATPQGTPDYVPGLIGSNAVHYSTDTGAGTFNYVSLVDTNTMTSAWPDLAFGSGSWSASYWIKLPDYNRVPFLCSSAGGVRPNGDYYNGGGFATGCEYNSGIIGGRGTAEVWLNGGFCWAVTNDFAFAQWHHIALTKGGADVNYRVKLYVDGVPNSDAWGFAATTDSPNPWNIGQDGMGTLAQDGSGVMDDLGIWNRELTPLEVYSIREVGLNGKSLNQVAPVQVYLSQVGTNLDLSWQAGTLLSSTNAANGYTPVAGATAPFYRTTATGTAKFFRVQQ
ncbi:MAG: immunoglobulin domain-containing protein [Verrucomicrobia bacterium]|nr:immunoglobulin domain-containing protein [Verrucomicrobiota bacterium]